MAFTSDLDRLRLTLTSDGYSYDIYPIAGVDPSQSKEAVSIAPPGQGPRQNIFLGIQGMQGELQVSFAALDDGTDKANGTAPAGEFANDTVVTLAEQKRWLEDYIHARDFTAAWELDHLTGEMFDAEPIGNLEQLTLPVLQRDSRKWVQWTMRLRRGAPV